METSKQQPDYASGKICYVEIPASDVQRSADFYHRAFGWRTHRSNDGSLAFDDTVGQVSGMWVTGRKAAAEPGLLISIMVADAGAACQAIREAGGEITRPVDPDASEITAWFRDPAGNVLGIYQQAGLSDNAPS